MNIGMIFRTDRAELGAVLALTFAEAEGKTEPLELADRLVLPVIGEVVRPPDD